MLFIYFPRPNFFSKMIKHRIHHTVFTKQFNLSMISVKELKRFFSAKSPILYCRGFGIALSEIVSGTAYMQSARKLKQFNCTFIILVSLFYTVVLHSSQ